MKFHSTILLHFAAFYLIVNKVNALRLPDAGVCPNLPPPSYCTDNYDFCKTDEDCGIADYKCCWNGCKNICAAAVLKATIHKNNTTIDRQRPGNCPVLPIRKFCIDHDMHECSDDYDCKEYYKCCSNGCTRHCVVSTAKKAIGSGSTVTNATCPVFPTSSSNCPVGIPNKCTADIDCRDQGDSFKCCWDGCRKLCLDPSEIRQTDGRGSCPGMLRPSVCGNVEHECLNDKECIRGQKCCSDGCSLKCVDAKDTKKPTKNDTTVEVKIRLDDECPFVTRPAKCPSSSLHQCYRNEECPDPLTCCSDGCRNICQDLDQDTTRILCPILRRPDVCLNINNTCTNIEDCNIDQTCCSDGCRFRCFGQAGFESENNGSHAIKPLISAADIVFVMDTSDGPRGSEFELQKSFTSSLSQYFNLGPGKVNLAIIASGEKAEILNQLTSNVTHSDIQVILKLGLKQEGGGRDLAAALQVTQKLLRSGRLNIPRLVIVFSFGLPSSSRSKLSVVSRVLHNQGVIVLAIGVDVEENEPQLRAIVTRHQDLFTFQSARSLENVVPVFASYVVGRAENAVPEFFSIDIIVLVDSSDSVGRENLAKVKHFILSMARALNVGQVKSRASIVTFGDVVAEITADFGSLDSLNKMKDVLKKMTYLGGDSKIDIALKKVPNVLDSTRPRTRKAAFLITDPYHITDNVSLKKAMLPLRKRGLESYALVVGGDQVGLRRLYGFISRPDDVFLALNYDTLTSLVTPIARHIVNGQTSTTAAPLTTAKAHEPTTGASLPNVAEKTTSEALDTTTAAPPTTEEDVPTTIDEVVPVTKAPKTTTRAVPASTAEQLKKSTVVTTTVEKTRATSPTGDHILYSGGANGLFRPGKCPKMTKPGVCGSKPNIECNYDVDCRKSPTQKCCTDGCNRQCVEAIGLKPVIPVIPVNPVDPPTDFAYRPGNILGRCPPYSPTRNCPALVQDDCTCSSDCGFGNKCCFDGCKRVCTTPKGNECSTQVDIVYLMDTSGSISLSDYRREKQFVKDLARIFRVGKDASQAAVTIYNDDPHERITLGELTSPDDFEKAIDDIPYLHGRTRIDKALNSSFYTFQKARPNKRKILVLLTDGRQTQDPDTVPLDQASQPLKDMGVKIYAIGVGHEIDRAELDVITGSPEAVFTVDSFTALLGESQTIAEKACGDIIDKICIRGVDLGFIIDASESITDDDFVKEQNAVKAITDEFLVSPVRTRVGVVVYSAEPKLSIEFDQYSSNAEFNSAVNNLPHMQSHTRLDKALEYAASNLYNRRRPANPAIAIVMTDGKQTPGAKSLTLAVQPLRDLGVRVFAVGVGPRVSKKELREIVQRPDDVFEVDSFSQLIKEAKKITERACPAPSETKLPTIVPLTTTPQPSTSSTTTLATSPPISIKTNPCSHFLDIIFVLDSSRSMDVRQYVKQKEFVKRLAKIFNVGKGSRAAAIIYSDDPLLEINFNTFRTQEGFLAGVDNLPYIMQRTRIDKALIMASQVVKETRPGFPKAVIIMTDGRQTRDPGYTKLDVAAAPLHEAGAKVLVVGIGPAISVEELKKMVKNKTSDIFTVKSFDGLVNATSSVAIKSCEGTAPTVEQRPCSQIFDIAFVMDSSGSMKISNYNKQKSFVKSIAGRFSVGENQVKVGLLSFSDGPSIHVAFNSSSSVFIKEFNAAVDRAEFIEGRTRIDKALEEASNMFKNGRPNVPKLLVFLTDGQQSLDPGYVPIDDAVRPLNDQNVHIMVVGVGQDIDTSHRELLSLANNREKDVIKVRSFDDLDKVKNSFVQTICRKIEEIVQAGAF